MRKKSSFIFYATGVLLLIVAFVLIWALLNRDWLTDWWRGKDYQPVGEMGRIMQDLKLTDRGEFLFRASWPALNSRDDFNTNCRSVLNEETAVLGCYTNNNIYVYNIESTELDGIRELTTAHELLHAVWRRMSVEERNKLTEELKVVYEQNKDRLEEEIGTYDESEQQEELYVRAGTEIKKLTDNLEKHYAEIFTEQDLVVSYYDKYIAVFKEIEADMNNLKAEMDDLDDSINALTDEYERRIKQLDADIVSFNACAEVAGCFTTEEQFNTRRNGLLTERASLEDIYNQINDLIASYNDKVEKYNSDVTRTQHLNEVMNSNKKVDELPAE